ncbi:hypothetical protein EDC96DRAFT_150651 [Choanephora cucurbitarum]|nr:hypothetical protein EDC96DRAFT_150651 [Choanephora cucurbitarum]
MIAKCLDYLADTKSNFFVWMRGSDTLSLLASFPEGRDIMFAIVQKENLSITLFNRLYPDKNITSTNALTILINELDFGLYRLLLNKIIQGAQSYFGDTLSFCITNALVLLQLQGNKELLSKTMNSLDFIPVIDGFEFSEIEVESFKKFDFSIEQGLIQDSDAFRNTFIDSEQIETIGFYYAKLRSLWSTMTRKLSLPLHSLFAKQEDIHSKTSSKAKSSTGNYIRLCAVPLSYFNSYLNRNSDVWSVHDSIQTYRRSSLFISMATDSSKYTMFDEGNLIVALMLSHKWKRLVKHRFIAVYLIHVFYYITYFLAVPFSRERFGYIPGNSSISDSTAHLVLVILFFFLGALFVFQEIRQCCSSRRKYFNSLYNAVDITLIVLMMFTFFQMAFNLSYQNEVQSICTLIVWLHGLLRLRAFMNFGIALEVVIRLFQKVFQIILFMMLVVFAFTHAFIVLLRQEEDSYFEEEYNGTITTNMNGIETNNTVTFFDGGSNDFTDLFKSFKDVWFFIYGIWDPINKGESANNVMAMILSVVFSFIVLLLFFNIVIGFMSASIEEVLKHGRKVWLNHFRDVIVEIEQSWCSDSERRDYRNNPARLYYAATEQEIRNQQKILMEESDMLQKEYLASLSKDSVYYSIVEDS